MIEFGFEKLETWKKARSLVKEIYLLVGNFPYEERYALSDQLRRAIVSVASNIAEGGGRTSNKEKMHFCQMAYGSLMEVTAQLLLAEDLEFITAEQNFIIRPKIEELERLIRGYHNYLKTKC